MEQKILKLMGTNELPGMQYEYLFQTNNIAMNAW